MSLKERLLRSDLEDEVFEVPQSTAVPPQHQFDFVSSVVSPFKTLLLFLLQAPRLLVYFLSIATLLGIAAVFIQFASPGIALGHLILYNHDIFHV